jgi:hypothetical protein
VAHAPGTAFRAGIVGQRKAAIIASATAQLDPAEARAAEAKVLDRAGTLTPPALRAAIQRAVMQVAPNKAKQRREHEAKKTRVERWAEASGNAGLAGRELPPAQVLAADQRVTAWAKELRKAGVEGGMDVLRARAYLDILLGMDSRLLGTKPDETRQSPANAIPPGFAGSVTLTIPEATVTGRADRPGELGGIGPIDPDLARDLVGAAARNPRSTWCVTVTDKDGHAVGHGCARPARRRKPDGHDPPFTLTPADQPDLPGGYGTWRFSTGQQDLLIKIGPLPTGQCDHRHEAKGHDPGVMLRHLTEVRHATCTGPGCRRPASRCDFEHNIPYDLPGGYVRWTMPSGRQYVTEPTRYPT